LTQFSIILYFAVYVDDSSFEFDALYQHFFHPEVLEGFDEEIQLCVEVDYLVKLHQF
jgi:hypothetical protein